MKISEMISMADGLNRTGFKRCLICASLVVGLILPVAYIYRMVLQSNNGSIKFESVKPTIMTRDEALALEPFIVIGPGRSDMLKRLTYGLLKEGVPLLPLEAY